LVRGRGIPEEYDKVAFRDRVNILLKRNSTAEKLTRFEPGLRKKNARDIRALYISGNWFSLTPLLHLFITTWQ